MIKENNSPQLMAIRFDTLDYPLIHFFKLLRDTNIHLESIEHHPSPRNYVYGNFSTGEVIKGENGEDFVDAQNVFTIKNCGPQTLKCNNLKYYKDTDIKVITEWVNVNQHEFGLQYLLELALKQYCEEIVAVI